MNDVQDNLLTTVTVTNPMKEDFECMWGKQIIRIPALKTITLALPFAEHAAKHLANKVLLSGGRFNDFLHKDKVVSRPVSRSFRIELAKSFINMDADISVKDVILKANDLMQAENNTATKKARLEAERAENPGGAIDRVLDVNALEAPETETAKPNMDDVPDLEPAGDPRTKAQLIAYGLTLGIPQADLKACKVKVELEALIKAKEEQLESPELEAQPETETEEAPATEDAAPTPATEDAELDNILDNE